MRRFHLITSKIYSFVQLTKPVISVSVALSAFTGFLLRSGFFSAGWIETLTGVFFLSAGSSTLNHIQEIRSDRLMNRTRNRPLPAGRIKKLQAVIFAVILIICGSLILYRLPGPIPLFLGWLTIIWYNLVYTPLKRVTAFASIPGAVVGALPPLIGWSAAGGSILQFEAITLSFLFFIGQIPHFWLILFKNDEDYQKAGFPSMLSFLSLDQLVKLTMVWILTTAMAAIMLVLFRIIRSELFSLLLLGNVIFLIYSFRNWIKGHSHVNPGQAFFHLNTFYLLTMLILIGDAVLTHYG